MATARRTVSLAEVAAQRAMGTEIAPGLWRDAAGDMHFSVPELLALFDIEDTPENREKVIVVLEQSLRANGMADVDILRQDLRLD